MKAVGLLLGIGLLFGLTATSEAKKPNPAEENIVVIQYEECDVLSSPSHNPYIVFGAALPAIVTVSYTNTVPEELTIGLRDCCIRDDVVEVYVDDTHVGTVDSRNGAWGSHTWQYITVSPLGVGTHTIKFVNTVSGVGPSGWYYSLSATPIGILKLKADPEKIRANGSDTITLTAEVVDDKGNIITAFSGTADLSSSNSDALKVPATLTITKGTGTAKATAGKKADKVTVTASVENLKPATVEVKVGLFLVTAYSLENEKDYEKPGAPTITDPLDITGTYYLAFLNAVQRQGSGLALNGKWIGLNGKWPKDVPKPDGHKKWNYKFMFWPEGPKTRSGTTPTVGRTMAVDPEIIPFGTKALLGEGIGERVAEDTGDGVKQYRIDIFMETRKIANQFGRHPDVPVTWDP